jgi:hypothetical protein
MVHTARQRHSLAELTTRAAMNVGPGETMTAGVVSPAVVQLTELVLITTTIHRLFFAATGLLVTGVAALGVGLLAASIAPAHSNGSIGSDSQAIHGEQDKEKQTAPRA